MSEIVFDHAVRELSTAHARCLAAAAKLAYAGPDAVRAQAARWGFDDVRTFCVRHGDEFPLPDTQGFSAACDRMVVVAFRGTEPDQLRDWLSDGEALLIPHASGRGRVHQGFHLALDAVWPQVADAVAAPGRTVWFTGHSLGGALAVLAAARLYFADPCRSADGVCTFGQPRACDAALADAYDEALRGRTHRFVNNNDLVARLPPDPFYRHVAEEKYIDADGRLLPKPPSLLARLADELEGHLQRFPSLTDALDDHGIDRYLASFGA
ncbi:lipase family protein [Actinomadura atramentaria]|uniref:lipase family protein n=1 Tax=Actinomadura atramentaria TaxID=1990 RepID=UPI00037A0DC3|nr:lipase family protein [Actinomadura atramentaria]